MSDIWQSVPDSLTITIKQNVWYQGGICPEICQLNQIFDNGRLATIIDLISVAYMTHCAR